MYHMEDRDSIILAYRREGKSIRHNNQSGFQPLGRNYCRQSLGNCYG
jgi:hypothetical protein